METGAKSKPTGCFKCGRAGHWSRDCPNPSTTTDKPSLSSSSSFAPNGSLVKPTATTKKRAPIPKLTPELLLSDDGIGFVLRHFPRHFKYRGRGREVNDLGNLIRLYSEWHSHLLPYYSFDQFVRKAEQAASTKRVKTCIKELRERVASGRDPTRLYECPIEDKGPSCDQGVMNSEGLSDSHKKSVDADDVQEVMLNEIYEKATQEIHQTPRGERSSTDGLADATSFGKEASNTIPENGGGWHDETTISQEQRARMEANKLNAQERAKARTSSEVHITDEQRARMEMNRLKALERAAARAQLRHTAS